MTRDEHRERAGYATASMFKYIMAAKTGRAWITQLQNIRSKVAEIEGDLWVEKSSPATEFGQRCEPRGCALFTLETGIDCWKPGFIKLPGDLPIGASPDRYTSDGGLLEHKACFAATTFGNYEANGYLSARDQVQGQLWVCDKPFAWFVAFDPERPEGKQLFIQRVERDEEYIEKLAWRVRMFAEHLVAGTEPLPLKFQVAA